MISAQAVRRVVLVVCVAGIAGMIVSSIAGSNGAAMTFGLVAAVAVVCSIVATAVSTGRVDASAEGGRGGDADDLGQRVEAHVAALVASGADEAAVRALVADAVRLGRVLT